jgi:spore germination protein YaaH
MPAARIGALVVVIGITAAPFTTHSATQHHSSAVALRDRAGTIARGVVPLPSTGVERFIDATAVPTQPQKPANTAKAAPPPAPTPPPTPAPPPPPPARQVLGFAPWWTLDTWREWRMQDLSAIAYFAVTVDGNGNTVPDESWPAWQSQQLNDMVAAAHAAGVKVLVTVKCFDNGDINSMVTSGEHLATAVKTATDLMRMRGLDGVVLDFEGSPASPYTRQALVQFSGALQASVRAYRADAQYVMATYAGTAQGDGGLWDLPALSPTVDAFFVMAYDMAGGNTPGHASANAPLAGGQYNDTDTVAQYLTKTGADKLILGVPYYGYKWSVTTADPNAATIDGPQAAPYAQMLDDFGCAQRLAVHRDEANPWATWYSPPDGDPCGANLNAWRELYFETAASIGAKYDLVNRANLRGTGMWALGFDAGHGELWDTLQAHVTPKR